MARALGPLAIVVVSAFAVGCAKEEPQPKPAATPPPPPAKQTVDLATVPKGPMGEAILRGKQIVEKTFETLPAHVGNDLHCTSCHLDGGTVPNAGPWIGLPGIFPEYRARSGKADTLTRRINDCFERSMNGKALDPEGEDMTAILAYMSFISRDVSSGTAPPGRGFKRIDPPLTPNREAGAQKYTTLCVACHGPEGKGVIANGVYAFPPLWGDRAFNIGAGMARLDTAAAFIRWNMPRGAGGTVSDQDAYDIADYIIHQPRPDFAAKVHDWPKGGKPRDARY